MPEESKLLATEKEHLLTIGNFRNENCTLYCLYSMGNTSQSEKGDRDEDPHKNNIPVCWISSIAHNLY